MVNKVKTVYFHIDELARDSVVASALKQRLKRQGVELEYGNRNTSECLDSGFPFDLGIFPSADFLSGYFSSPEKISFPIVMLPTESVSGTKAMQFRLSQHLLGAEFAVSGSDEWLQCVSAFLLWGDSHLEVMQRCMPEMAEKFHVVAHPRHDAACLLPQTNGRPATNRIKVGFVSRFDLINIFDDRSNLTSIYNMRKLPGQTLQYFQTEDRDAEDTWHNAVLDLRNYFHIMDLLDPQLYDITLRIHPRENRFNWFDLKNRHDLPIEIADWRQPFAHWLQTQDVLIAPPSTSLYDCALLGKRVILTDRLNASRQVHTSVLLDDFDPIFDFFERPESMDDLLRSLDEQKDFVRGDGLAEVLARETGYPNQNCSLDKVVEIIMTLLENSTFQPSRSDKVRYNSRLMYINTRAHLRKMIKGDGSQSACFPLNAECRRFIDGLASS